MTDEDIVGSLLDYLRLATGCPAVNYADAPTRLSGGYDATILGFKLQSAPDRFSGPLVLRLFQASADPQRARREAVVQNALAELGYPAPRVFAAEARIDLLGGPFLIMERMPGRPLGSEFEGLSVKGFGQTFGILRQLPRIRRELLRLWDEAQTRLHALPVSGFVERVESAGVSADNFTFDSCFAGQRAAAEEFGLNGLRPLIDWLMANKPLPSQPPVICHGDFQPFNVLADQGRLTGVIDWVKATIADPAFDYGAMIAILATVPIRVPAGAHRLLRALMNNLARAHSRSCRSLLESRALQYYQVFNCLVQLITVGKIRAHGRTAHVYNSPIGVANLSNHVQLLTGLHVRIPV